MSQKPFTVISFSDDTGQTLCDHVHALNGIHAFWVAASLRPTMTMVAALPGHLTEGAGDLIFPGSGLVAADTILSQPEVFGPSEEGGATEQSDDVTPEIRKVLVLSTGHLTKATCLSYTEWPFISSFEQGCYFYVGDEPNLYPNAPGDLQNVLEFARRNGCIEVKFDRDAERIAALPWFDW